jgi:hypothetical protein
VAEILAYVYNLKNKNQQRASSWSTSKRLYPD